MKKVGESIPISILLYGIIFAMEVVGKDLSSVSDLMDVPAFVLLSPEGKVLSKRIGYGKGIIDWWLEKFIGASYTRVENKLRDDVRIEYLI